MSAPITIVDYGMGNIRSVLNALREVGAEGELVSDTGQIARCGKLILPGVGAFGAAMANLKRSGLDAALEEARRGGATILGICLGMQLLFASSEEDGGHHGLGWIPGQVLRFPETGQLRIPHMGWNELSFSREHALTRGVADHTDVYFLHSYYCACDSAADQLATAQYGLPFAAMVARDNLLGIQFHPEKSQRTGLALLKNFAGL
jgi:imidazole glycerol-phosphate synthase subunit HisH